jgi:NADH-quinone oxidoreductase subunit J
MSGILEWIIFLALSLIAVITAAGMLLTMSMYRTGLALMASFVALAGLFILLGADLLAAIQIMMNVGGMLVMVLFMVMIMRDPGGEMMWAMKRGMHLPGPGAFSMHMPWHKPAEEEPVKEPEMQEAEWTCPMHPEVRQNQPGNCSKCGMQLVKQEPVTESKEASGHQHMAMEDAGTHTHMAHMEMPGDETSSVGQAMQAHEMHMNHAGAGQGDPAMHTPNHGKLGHEMHMAGMTPRQYYQMMVVMAMSTAQLPWAIVLGVLSAILLIVLVVLSPWPLASTAPTQDATTAVGELLLSRYMIAFEGAAFLILAGIAGAVIFAQRDRAAVQQQAMQHEPATAEEQVYTCPMHPEVRQNQPGNCPRCGMSLIPVKEVAPASNGHEAHQEHGEHGKHGGRA